MTHKTDLYLQCVIPRGVMIMLTFASIIGSTFNCYTQCGNYTFPIGSYTHRRVSKSSITNVCTIPCTLIAFLRVRICTQGDNIYGFG